MEIWVKEKNYILFRHDYLHRKTKYFRIVKIGRSLKGNQYTIVYYIYITAQQEYKNVIKRIFLLFLQQKLYIRLRITLSYDKNNFKILKHIKDLKMEERI